MSETTQRIGGYEPSVRTVEMVCDRLAELGLAVGADTARALVRDVLAAEGPRIDARLRESVDTALQTIKIAAQSAMGLLATSGEGRGKEQAPPEQLHVSRRPPAPQQGAQQVAQQPPARKAAPAPPPPPRAAAPAPEPKRAEARPSGPRRPREDFEEEERRPMFRRPGRR